MISHQAAGFRNVQETPPRIKIKTRVHQSPLKVQAKNKPNTMVKDFLTPRKQAPPALKLSKRLWDTTPKSAHHAHRMVIPQPMLLVGPLSPSF
jgi:hypothetical protein